jgi:molybdate transport system ATP-binding protein
LSANQPANQPDSLPANQPGSILTLQMQHRIGALELDVALNLTKLWTVLFGPSGSGKTTVLRAIAGFVRPDAGRIMHGKTILMDHGARVFVPPYARPVRSAGQGAPLFPNLSVLQNIGYGVKSRIDGGGAEIVDNAVERFQLRALAHKSPLELSGGERQRVAVVRAATSAVGLGPGTLLLLDEPFTGLDLARQEQLLGELRSWLAENGVPVLSVTHDVGEAFQLGAEVIRIADGKVAAQGPATAVLADDRERLIDQLRG